MCCLFGSQKLKSKKHYLIRKNIFEVIFPMFFWDENFKTCLAFYFAVLDIIFGKLKMGRNNPEIANLEFENHDFLKKHAFLPIKQAGTNIC